MPYRSITAWVVVLGVVGLGLVAVLVVCGVDPRRAAASGPRWRRAPVAAALLLLGLLGGAAATNTACVSCYDPTPIEVSMKRTDFLDRLEALNRQLPLLEKYAAQEKIDKEVVRTLVNSAQRTVYLLKTEYARKNLTPEEYARAEALCRQAEPSIKALDEQVRYGQRLPASRSSGR